MDLLDLMDALQVHAVAAAKDAGGTAFRDVKVGWPRAKGRCVRIFYGGERETEHFFEGRTLASELIAQAVMVRGYWPTPQTADKEARRLEGEVGAWVKSFRSRVTGDKQLGGEGSDLNVHLASVDQLEISGAQYVVAEFEIVTDYDEHAISQ